MTASQIVELIVIILTVLGPLALVALDPKGIRKELGITITGRKI